MIVHAGTSGGIDPVPVKEVVNFEKQFLTYMRDSKPEVAEGINSTGKLSDEGKQTIEAACKAVSTQMGF
jgi:F0F1-type ATP synthase alpha subunit